MRRQLAKCGFRSDSIYKNTCSLRQTHRLKIRMILIDLETEKGSQKLVFTNNGCPRRRGVWRKRKRGSLGGSTFDCVYLGVQPGCEIVCAITSARDNTFAP